MSSGSNLGSHFSRFFGSLCNFPGIPTTYKSNHGLLRLSTISPSRNSHSSSIFLDGCFEDFEEDSLSEDYSKEEADEGGVVSGEAQKR